MEKKLIFLLIGIFLLFSISLAVSQTPNDAPIIELKKPNELEYTNATNINFNVDITGTHGNVSLYGNFSRIDSIIQDDTGDEYDDKDYSFIYDAWNDSNWDTSDDFEDGNTPRQIRINYTSSSLYSGANWEIKYKAYSVIDDIDIALLCYNYSSNSFLTFDSETLDSNILRKNYTIPKDCFSTTKLILTIQTQGTNEGEYMTFYEEQIYWNTSSSGFILNQTNSTENSGTVNYNFNVNLDEGAYLWGIHSCNNNTNNCTNSVNRTLIIDNTSPILTTIGPLNNSLENSKDIIFYYNITDLHPIANCSLFVDGNLNGTTDTSITKDVTQNFTRTLQEDNYNWEIKCYDNASNLAETGTYNISLNILGGLPVYSNQVINPASGVAYQQGATYQFNITWQDPDSTIDTAILSFDGVNYTMSNLSDVYYYNIEDKAVGNYNYIFWANDSENNQNQTTPQTYQIVKANSQVFTDIDGSRANNTIQNNTSVWLNGTLNLGVGNIKLFNNGVKINEGSSPIGNFTGYNATGLYNITTIYEGNENFTFGFETWYLNVTTSPDVTFPDIWIGFPENSTYKKLNLSLNVSSTSLDLDTWIFSLDGGSTNTTFTPNTTFISNQGSNKLTIFLNDTSNNLNTTSVSYFINTTTYDISISLNKPENNTNVTTNSAYFNWTTSFGFSQTGLCNFTLDHKINQTNINVSNGVLKNLNISYLANGYHNWSISCKDANSTNSTNLRTFHMNNPINLTYKLWQTLDSFDFRYAVTMADKDSDGTKDIIAFATYSTTGTSYLQVYNSNNGTLLWNNTGSGSGYITAPICDLTSLDVGLGYQNMIGVLAHGQYHSYWANTTNRQEHCENNQIGSFLKDMEKGDFDGDPSNEEVVVCGTTYCTIIYPINCSTYRQIDSNLGRDLEVGEMNSTFAGEEFAFIYDDSPDIVTITNNSGSQIKNITLGYNVYSLDLVDLTDDGEKEIIIAGEENVRAYYSNGSIMWGWLNTLNGTSTDFFNVKTGQVDGTQQEDIVVWSSENSNVNPLIVIEGADGSVIFEKNITANNDFISLGVDDIDADGKDDIVGFASLTFGSSDASGEVIWVDDGGINQKNFTTNANYSGFASNDGALIIEDADFDGIKEIIVGTNKGGFVFRTETSNPPPIINLNLTIPNNPDWLSKMIILANVTDSNNNLKEVNFSLQYPNGSYVYENLNGTTTASLTNWSSQIHNIAEIKGTYGTWSGSITAYDNGGKSDTETITFFIDDTTNPTVNITNPYNFSEISNKASNSGYENITLNNSVSDDHVLVNCSYWVKYTTSNLVEITNTTLTCGTNTTFDVSRNGAFTLYLYAEDDAGNLGVDTENFTISANASIVVPTGGGGSSGGASGGEDLIPVIGLVGYNETIYNYLEREILFAGINNYCSEKITGQTFAISDFSKECRLTFEDLDKIQSRLELEGFLFTSSDMTFFFKQFQAGLFFQGYETREIIEEYNLFTSVLGITNPMSVNPPSLRKPYVIFDEKETNLTYTFLVNKNIAECVVSEGPEELSCERVSNNTFKIIYELKELDFFEELFMGKVSITSLAQPSELEVVYVPIALTTYNFSYLIWGIEIWKFVIYLSVALLIVGFFVWYTFRQKSFKKWVRKIEGKA